MYYKNYYLLSSKFEMCPGGWLGGSPSDNKANLISTRLKMDLPTGTELGNSLVGGYPYSHCLTKGQTFSVFWS